MGMSGAGRHDPPIERQERGAVRFSDPEQVGICHLLMSEKMTENARCLGQRRQGFQINMLLIAGQIRQQIDSFGRCLAHLHDRRVGRQANETELSQAHVAHRGTGRRSSRANTAVWNW